MMLSTRELGPEHLLLRKQEVGMAQTRNPMGAEALGAFIQEKTETDNVPGLSVAVVKRHRVVWKRGFGFADLATSPLAPPTTSSLWFPMTKIVTATAVLQLAERGSLDLD